MKNYEDVSRRFFLGIFNKIKKIKKSGKWLDVGCGKGYLLNIASKYNYKCYGLDINNDFIPNDKINFISKNLLESDFKDNEFDIVTMINVLDHIGSPNKYFKKLNDILKKNGILFIHVPNEYYFNKKLFCKFTQYSPNVHLVNYSEKNIVQILENFNFSKVSFLPLIHKYYNNNMKKMCLIYLLEIYNRLAIKINKGIWISMQLIAYK